MVGGCSRVCRSCSSSFHPSKCVIPNNFTLLFTTTHSSLTSVNYNHPESPKIHHTQSFSSYLTQSTPYPQLLTANLTNFAMASQPSLPSVHAAICENKHFPCHIKILRAELAAARSSMGKFLKRNTIQRLKLTRTTDADLLDSALKILETTAQRLNSLKSSTLSIDQDQLDDIATEYYMLRVRLVCSKLFHWKVCSRG